MVPFHTPTIQNVILNLSTLFEPLGSSTACDGRRGWMPLDCLATSLLQVRNARTYATELFVASFPRRGSLWTLLVKNFDIVEDDLTTTRHRWDDVTLKIRNCGIYPNIKKAKVLGWKSVLKVSKDSRSPVFSIYIVKKVKSGW